MKTAVGVLSSVNTAVGYFRADHAIASARTNPSDDALRAMLADIFTTPASLAGLPAVSIPCGCDDTGLPLSLQLMAAPFAEASLLRAARAFERDFAWSVAPRFRGETDAA